MSTTEKIYKLHEELFQQLLGVDVEFYTDEDRENLTEKVFNAPVIETYAEKTYTAYVQKLRRGYVYAYDVERDQLTIFKMTLLDRSEVFMLATKAGL